MNLKGGIALFLFLFLSACGQAEGTGLSQSYNPEPLSWTSEQYPQRDNWSDALFNFVGQNISTLSQARDITSFCSNYNSMSRDQQINTWAAIISATTFYESGYNPLSYSVDVGNPSNRDTWSVGLLQLSVVDQKSFGINYGYSFTDLQDPIKNLEFGVAVMARQISLRGLIMIPAGMSGVYWAVLHPGGRYDKSYSIIQMTKKLSFCQ